MALIIEDGTGKADAQSYVSLAEFKAFYEARGFDFIGTESMLVKAMDYLETLNYLGTKAFASQALSFPRVILTTDVAPFTIPQKLKSAQMQLAIAVALGVDLMPTRGATGFVKREKVGPIETEYSETVNAGISPEFPIVDALLADLVSGGTDSFFLVSRRV